MSVVVDNFLRRKEALSRQRAAVGNFLLDRGWDSSDFLMMQVVVENSGIVADWQCNMPGILRGWRILPDPLVRWEEFDLRDRPVFAIGDYYYTLAD